MAQHKGWIKILKRYAIILPAIGLAFNINLKAQNTSCDSAQNHGNNKLILIVEKQPEYKYGGVKGLLEFISRNVKYPDDSVRGKVMVGFLVDTMGNVKDTKILRGLSEAADKEALRVVELTEWIPARQGGKKVKVQMVVPVNFRLDNDKNNKKKKIRKRQKQ